MPDEYPIGSGLSEEELKVSSWWLKHGQIMSKLGRGALIAFAVLCWGFSAWILLDTYAISYPREERIPLIAAQNQLASEAYTALAPQPLQLTSPSVFASTNNRRDILFQVGNPNPRWWAEFEYRFDLGEIKTAAKRGYALPQSQRYLTFVGITEPVGNPQLELFNIRWRRLDPNQIDRNYEKFLASRNQMQFLDISYTNDLRLDSKIVGQTSFVLNNPSAYGFWEVDVTVILYRLGSPIAVTTITERQVKPGEKRPIKITWPENLNNINKTEIQANVNILDPKAYLPSTQF